MKITPDTKSITFKVKNTTGEPDMALRRVGTNETHYLDYLGRKGDDVTFAIDPTRLRSGRYYANASFRGRCCMTAEVFVEDCGLASASLSSTPAACGTC
jgi:hypothetical protein